MEDRTFYLEELRRIFSGDKLSLRDRAFIMLAATTGLRVGTLLSLKYGDVVWNLDEAVKAELRKDGIRYEYKFDEQERTRILRIAMIKIHMKEGRKLQGQNGYFNFISSETREALEQYFAWRSRNGENITSESYLIGKSAPNFCFEPMEVTPMDHHWRMILKRNGFERKKDQKWHPLHLHTLRKFHFTKTTQVEEYSYVWRGQKQGQYLQDEYMRHHLDEHIKAFLKIEPELRIGITQPEMTAEQAINVAEESRNALQKQAEQIQELQQANEALRKHAEKLTQESTVKETLLSDTMQKLQDQVESTQLEIEILKNNLQISTWEHMLKPTTDLSPASLAAVKRNFDEAMEKDYELSQKKRELEHGKWDEAKSRALAFFTIMLLSSRPISSMSPSFHFRALTTSTDARAKPH